MTIKTKTIKLTNGWTQATDTVADTSYRIEQVTDTTEFSPGKMLSKTQVDELCASGHWRVTIVAYKPAS
jgi:hypothetical protein